MAVMQASDAGVLLRIRVQPRARADRIEGVYGDQLRIRLTAPPVDGAANAACLAFLAKSLSVKRSQVHLRAGLKSRDKVVFVSGLTPEQITRSLGIS